MYRPYVHFFCITCIIRIVVIFEGNNLPQKEGPMDHCESLGCRVVAPLPPTLCRHCIHHRLNYFLLNNVTLLTCCLNVFSCQDVVEAPLDDSRIWSFVSVFVQVTSCELLRELTVFDKTIGQPLFITF